MHTKGPWHIGGTFWRQRGIDKNAERIALVNIWGPTPEGMQSGETIAKEVTPANALLIASAPDLLDACQAALLTLNINRKYVECVPLEDKLRKVLAMATGNNYERTAKEPR